MSHPTAPPPPDALDSAESADGLRRRVQELTQRCDELRARTSHLRQGLEAVLGSPAWRWVHKFRRAREKLAPYGTWRAEAFWWIADRLLGRPRELRGRPAALGGGAVANGGPVAALDAILTRHADRKGIVVFPPIVDWGWMRQRPHQFALEFAKSGYLVFYCPPQSRTDFVPGFREVAPGVQLCGCIEWLYELHDAIVIMGKPQHWEWVRHFRAPRIVYDYFDELGLHSPDGRARPRELRTHERLLRQAAVVSVTAERLIQDARRVRPDALLCPNAVDYEHFHREAPPTTPDDLRPILARGRPIVGYHGALAAWFDFALLCDVARLRPGVEFVLIGPDYDGAAAATRTKWPANVTWLGEEPYEELPAYVHAFTAAMIPFVLNEITLATNPIKLFEYFAAGKPVVSTALPECCKFPSVLIADSAASFCGAVDQAIQLAGDPSQRDAAIALARENSWTARVADILARLPSAADDAAR